MCERNTITCTTQSLDQNATQCSLTNTTWDRISTDDVTVVLDRYIFTRLSFDLLAIYTTSITEQDTVIVEMVEATTSGDVTHRTTTFGDAVYKTRSSAVLVLVLLTQLHSHAVRYLPTSKLDGNQNAKHILLTIKKILQGDNAKVSFHSCRMTSLYSANSWNASNAQHFITTESAK